MYCLLVVKLVGKTCKSNNFFNITLFTVKFCVSIYLMSYYCPTKIYGERSSSSGDIKFG